MSLNADSYEPNDSFTSAKELEKATGTFKNLTIHNGSDEDFFKITLPNTLGWDQTNYGPKIDTYDAKGGNNSKDARTELKAVKSAAKNLSIHSPGDKDHYRLNLTNTGMDKNFVQATFANTTGKLAMTVYNSKNEVMATSTSEDNSLISMKGWAADDYTVLVEGVDGAQGTYTLGWDQTNYGPKIDTYDAKGNNGPDGTPTRLTAAKSTVKNLSIHTTTDKDCYTLHLSNTGLEKNFLQATFANTTGTLVMKVLNSKGELVAASTSTDNNPISMKGWAEGDYTVLVEGENGAQGAYTLGWDQTNYGPKIDTYEGTSGNNKIGTATPLSYDYGTAVGKTNIHSGLDVDYFKITLKADGQFLNYFQIYTINASGPLELKLFDSEGKELRSAWAPMTTMLDVTLDGLSAGTYYARVSGVDGAVGSYNIAWDQSAYLPSMNPRFGNDPWTADKYEGNDSTATATTLVARMGNVYNLTVHNASDVDYYKITLTDTGTSSSWVSALFNKNTGLPEVTLCDAAGNELRTAEAHDSPFSKHLSLEGLSAGSYYVKVQGKDNSQSTYTLYWNKTNYNAEQPGIGAAVGLSETTGTFTEATDVKYYSFELAADGTSANSIFVTSDDNLRVSLLNADGREIHVTEQGRINLDGLASGNYYLQIKSEDMISADSSKYSISYDITSSSQELVMGTEYSSLFALNDFGTEYAYIMGYGNLSLSDFGDAGIANTRMAFSNDLIIDAEKSVSNKRDNEQCWAATASNMLAWSGWGAKGIDTATGVTAEDVIFAEYSKYFPDKANNTEEAIGWFFNSEYKLYNGSLTAAAGSGNYLQTSALPGLTKNPVNGVHELHDMADALDNNKAVGLTIGYYASASSKVRSGGHVITVWGYTFDPTKERNESGYYTGLIVTDSDDQKNVTNATDASDTLNMISIYWDLNTLTYYTKYQATGSKVSKLESFITLDHYDNWSTESGVFMASAAESALPAAGNDLDSLLASAVQPSADTMRAASELTHSNDKNNQNGMLTA